MPAAGTPKLKRGSHVDLSDVIRVTVLNESWALALGPQLYLLSSRDSHLVEMEIHAPVSVLVAGADVLVGTEAGHLVRIDPKDNLPTRVVDVGAVAAPGAGKCPVHVMTCEDGTANVLCEGMLLEINI